MASTSPTIPRSHHLSSFPQSTPDRTAFPEAVDDANAFANSSDTSANEFPWVSDSAGQGTGRNGHRRGQEHLRFLVPHPPGKIPVGGADAFQRLVHPAEG